MHDRLTRLAAAIVSLVLIPGGQALPSPPGRADYADQCAADMGAIPPFDCMTGDLLDITVNGANQSQPVPDGKCDKPVQLGLPDNQCVPFSRLLRINTGKPNVTTIAICRKYFASNGAQDPRFDDIAMIQHDASSGRTCFFQSPLEKNLNGTSVPSPSDRTANGQKYWQDNSDRGPGGIACSSCHAADPFIWSSFVAQKADLSKWDPLGKYDSNFANLFGSFTKVFSPSGNGCTGCHRFGRGPANDYACKLFPTRYTGHLDHATRPDEFLMPPGFGTNASAWHSSFDTSFVQIERCCDNPNLSECRTKLADGDHPPAVHVVAGALLAAVMLPLQTENASIGAVLIPTLLPLR
jgi:hypothetical protein